jgi:hypothetical protein
MKTTGIILFHTGTKKDAEHLLSVDLFYFGDALSGLSEIVRVID